MNDLEKVVLAYKCCKNSYDRICEKCPYEKDCCHDGIPMFVIKKMVELLKEQKTNIGNLNETVKNLLNAYTEIKAIYGDDARVVGELVRCKDCKHRGDSLNCHVALIADLLKDTRVFTYKVTDEWFCADGERKTDDD